MNANELMNGLLWFIAFIFSTTCHEAAHAWAARRGGDDTAYAGAQVTLDPLPHIRREPFGMVIMPWLSYFANGWMMGWASAPYNPRWARAYPRRSAWMALAGPAANFAIAIAAFVLIHAGRLAGVLQIPAHPSFESLVQSTSDGPMQAIAALLSVLFALNLILGSFNLIPIPPLDGFGVLGLFVPGSAMLKLMDLRDSMGQMIIIGLLVAWKAADYIIDPVLGFGVRLLYM